MVKKIIGVIATLGVVAIVVMAAMNYGNYKSMLPENLFTASAPASGPVSDSGSGSAKAKDSAAKDSAPAEKTDSLTVGKADGKK